MVSTVFKWIGILFALFVVISLNLFPLGPEIFRPLVVLISSIIIFYSFQSRHRWLDYTLVILGIITFGYAVKEIEGILERAGIFTTSLDLLFGTLAILLVLEMTRRTVGIALPIITIVFILYALFGQYIPGWFGHAGYSYSRIVTALFTYNGIFGTPLAVTSTFVAMFIVFAAILDLTGVGNVFLDLSKSIAGKYRGGPAKIATVASALFGSISGSAVANVAATGSFTIPMMKKMGFKNKFAAAVESAASTGGQFMPPVMAAGAFLMADIVGVPYADIMKAALIPALLYFITLWISVDFYSAKTGLRGLTPVEIPDLKQLLLKDGLMLLPIIVLIIQLTIFKVSPIRAALAGIVVALVISLLTKRRRPSFKATIDSLYDASKGIVSIIAPVSCAGIVIGIIGLTGLGGKIASFVISFAGGHLLIALFLSMITAIIFGMGLPTTVAYLLVVAVLVPVLSELGIPPLSAHLFIFYYACLSGITPPVALAAYTGANIAGSKPMLTAFLACKLAMAAFVLPFLFIFEPALLMEGSLSRILLASLTAMVGLYSLAASFEGWLFTKLNLILRIILFIGGIVLIIPGSVTSIIGFALLAMVMVIQKIIHKKSLKNVELNVSERL